MSQTTDDLSTAVAAIVARLEDLVTENATLTSQNAALQAQVNTYADLANKAAALETAAAADVAAEQDAIDKLNTALAAAASPEPAPTTAELDAAATV